MNARNSSNGLPRRSRAASPDNEPVVPRWGTFRFALREYRLLTLVKRCAAVAEANGGFFAIGYFVPTIEPGGSCLSGEIAVTLDEDARGVYRSIVRDGAKRFLPFHTYYGGETILCADGVRMRLRADVWSLTAMNDSNVVGFVAWVEGGDVVLRVAKWGDCVLEGVLFPATTVLFDQQMEDFVMGFGKAGPVRGCGGGERDRRRQTR